jgi:dGTPase
VLGLEERHGGESGSREGDDRTPFQEDRDIILYSSAFKRLLSVTQVTSASAGPLLHTRLTHSLQVAQVGRRLAEKLIKHQAPLCEYFGGIDPDRVETACLAHDIGHPPFGHLAETALDTLAKDFGGFEGNAQSFRIVTRLGVRTLRQHGLNLTRGTLQALSKYPWLYSDRPLDPHHPTGRKPKWGAYDADKTVFDWIWASEPTDSIRSKVPEAEIMDWADDVTYSVHDVEDFFRAGLIPLHLLKKEVGASQRKERERFFSYVVENERKDGVLDSLKFEEIEKIFDNLLIYATFQFEQPYEDRREDHANLRMFTSRLIGRFINALQLREPDKLQPKTVKKNELEEREVSILKQLTWFYVIEAPGLAIQHQAQKKIIKRLARTFLNEAGKANPSGILSASYRDYLKHSNLSDEEKCRTAIDLVSSMTESQVIDLYQRLEGISIGSGLDKVFV